MMMYRNPFSDKDSDHYHIWQMLVHRDIEAFVRQDWSMVANDFLEEGFMGIDAGGREDPKTWQLKYPSLESYKNNWLKQSKTLNETDWEEDLREALFRVTVLKNIDVQGGSALAHKWFVGNLVKTGGELVPMNWQTLYRCRKFGDQWKIAGFTGYLPLEFTENTETSLPAKQVPEGASQHKTAGPYSPVLKVNPGHLVVTSGQAAIDKEGAVIGDTIKQQTAYTLDNCRKQLESAGCTLDDVFKVNVYLKDLDDWPKCNKIYKKYFSNPLPVRTAVQTGLLSDLLIEMEIWAAKQ